MAQTIEAYAAYVLPHIKPDLKILDIGCGTGSLTCDFAKHVPDGSVIGVDKSEDDLTKARELAKSSKKTNVSFLAGNAMSLDFPDNEFDIVHSNQSLHHVNDVTAVLREMKRVAKPGGIVAARDRSRMLYWPKTEEIDKFLEISDKITEGTGGNTDTGANYRKFAREAGFKEEDVAITNSTWSYTNKGNLKSICQMYKKNILKASYKDNALKYGVVTEAGLERISEAWGDFGDLEDAWVISLFWEMIAKKPKCGSSD